MAGKSQASPALRPASFSIHESRPNLRREGDGKSRNRGIRRRTGTRTRRSRMHLRSQTTSCTAELMGGNKLTIKAGESAPDFTLVASNGAPVILTNFRGAKVLLWFF